MKKITIYLDKIPDAKATELLDKITELLDKFGIEPGTDLVIMEDEAEDVQG